MRYALALLAALWLTGASAQIKPAMMLPQSVAPQAAGGTVTFDAKGTAACDTTSSPLTCTTLTVGTGGSNYALVVYATYYAGAQATVLTATWNGTSVPNVLNAYGTIQDVGVAVWCLAAPASGNKTLSISITASGLAEIHAIAASYTGANQTTPCANATSYFSPSGPGTTTGTITVTSATGDIATAEFSQGQTSESGMNGTVIVINDDAGPNVDFNANYIAGAATVNLTCTASSGTASWAIGAVDIQAAP